MKYIATGRVLPERTAVSIQRVKFEYTELGYADISCDASQLSILLDSESISDLLTAKMRAYDAAGMLINALGYSFGCGYTIEITQVTAQDGTAAVFGVTAPSENVFDTLRFSNHQVVFEKSLFLSSRNIFFRFAIRDYLRAILDEMDCAYYCYRAIESIRSAFDNENDSKGWKLMHTNLNTTQLEITSIIKQFADPTRHGNWINAKYTDSGIRWKMLEYTKSVLDKYLTYEESVGIEP